MALLESKNPLSYLLLQCHHQYLVVNMYAGLEVCTSITIKDGQCMVCKYQELILVSPPLQSPQDAFSSTILQEYITQAAQNKCYAKQNWDFIKLHLSNRLFDDIEAKGVTHNYNTKPNEKMHGPVKKAYRDHMNFKDIASQV